MGHPDGPKHLSRGEVLQALYPVLYSDKTKVNQNIGFDVLSLEKFYGAEMPGPFRDTHVLCHLWRSEVPGGLNLGNLSKRYLGFKYQKLAREGAIDTFPFWDVASYVGYDALVAQWLYILMLDRIENSSLKKVWDLEASLTEAVVHLRRSGITVNREGLKELSIQMAAQAIEADKRLRSYVPADWVSPNNSAFNSNSTPHLQKLFYKDLQLPVTIRTPKGQPSTDKYALDQMDHPAVESLKNLRDINKTRSTYVEGVLERLDKDGKLRANWNQCGTSTGRLSCSQPNLQNLPSANDISEDSSSKIRNYFIASPGYALIGADYSQIEGRTMGELCYRSGVGKSLYEVFLEPDVDWHAATAQKMFRVKEVTKKQRSTAKTANFALLYGGFWTLLVHKFKMSKVEANKTYELFHAAYPELNAYTKLVCDEAREKRYPYTSTLLGRRRFFPDLLIYPNSEDPDLRKAQWKKLKAAEREAMNHTVQGTAGDLLKAAMVDFYNAKKSTWNILVSEHDALVVEAPEKDALECSHLLKEVMENASTFSLETPAEVKVGHTWYEVK